MAKSCAHTNALRKFRNGRPPGKKRSPVPDDHVYQIDSDLSADMAVSPKELHAIARLLSEEIEKIFSDIS
jgi:hypothetical protein